MKETQLPGEGGLFHNLIFRGPYSNALIKVGEQNSSHLLLLAKALLFSRGPNRDQGLEVAGEANYNWEMPEKRLRWEYAGNIRSQMVGPG